MNPCKKVENRPGGAANMYPDYKLVDIACGATADHGSSIYVPSRCDSTRYWLLPGRSGNCGSKLLSKENEAISESNHGPTLLFDVNICIK